MSTAPHLSPHTSPTVDLTADAGPPTVGTDVGRGRTRLVAGALTVAATSVALLVATHPWGQRLDSSADEVISYDVLLRSDRDVAWTSLSVNGFAFAVVALCAALTTCLLVRERGRVAAVVGSVLIVAGGVLFAMGSFAFATLTWFATSGSLSEEAGRELVAVADDTPARLLGLILVGFLLATLGGLAAAVALARARAVPPAAVAGFVVLTLALFVPLPAGGVDVAQVLQMVLVALLGVTLWRRAGG